MKRYLAIALLVVTTVAILIVVTKPSSRIEIVNAGSDVIEVKTNDSEMTMLLGQNAIGYFDCNSKIHIADATISLGQRFEVVNTGSNVIQVTSHDATGTEHTTMLGEGGSGYFSQATPIKLGDVTIRVGKTQ